MTEPPFIRPSDFNRGRDFDREACRRHCLCDVNFVGALVAGYQAETRRNWERCLDKIKALAKFPNHKDVEYWE